jgi:hypothetical protein
MFARHLSLHLKPNSIPEFTAIYEKQILPLLRAQPGFQDVTTFAASSGKDVSAISVWDTRENAELYASKTFAEALKLLDKVVDGPHRVRISEVLHSTSQNVSVAAA